MKNLRFNARRDANELELVEFLELSGCLVGRLNGKDIPDLLCTHRNGKLFTVEVKTPKGVLSDGQKEFAAKQRARNALSFVCTTIDDIKLALVVVANA